MNLPLTFERYKTPYNPDWPTTTRVAVKLLIHSKIMNLEEITTALGLQPTQAYAAATHLPPGESHLEFRRTTNTWGFTSEDEVDSMDLRDHIDWLLDRIVPKAADLEAIREGGRVQASIVASYALLGTGGPSLWPRQMRAFSDLDMELSFHLIFDPGER